VPLTVQLQVLVPLRTPCTRSGLWLGVRMGHAGVKVTWRAEEVPLLNRSR
jgi:hypothetical protein